MKTGYTLGNRKVAIIWAGYVGATVAYALSLRDIAREIVLIDRGKSKAEGEAWDIRHGIPMLGTAACMPETMPTARTVTLSLSRLAAIGHRVREFPGDRRVRCMRCGAVLAVGYYTRWCAVEHTGALGLEE